MGNHAEQASLLPVRIGWANNSQYFGGSLADTYLWQLDQPDSFRLLERAPKQRRQYLDWGVFLPRGNSFSGVTWQRLQKSLKATEFTASDVVRIERSLLAPWETRLVEGSEAY